ncbi:type II toxin-antitoxin system death-on-curing family toxin [Catellatospora sichuanensis]|uniref:type II toxin-antitoxin system death-on-curing family toxin n=1 Tax=Catellatospora sichuanensis TaxID=1969805 RepID=UPI0011845DB7|nr:Fic family protein [Catellatospora sichuanensis]
MSEVYVPTYADVLAIADRLGVAVRDPGLVESAVARPRSTAFGADAYPDLWTKAAALLQSLTRNHAFVDGNKRIGWITATAFLTVNGAVSRRRLAALDQNSAYDLVIAVCTGELRDIEEIAQALRALY